MGQETDVALTDAGPSVRAAAEAAEGAGRPPARAKTPPERRRGEMKDGPLPEGLRIEKSKSAVAFISPWLRIVFDLDRPIVRWFSLDGTGGGEHTKNLLKASQGIDAVAKGQNEEASAAAASFTVSRSGNVLRYSGIQLGSLETVDLTYAVRPKGLHVAIDRHVPAAYGTRESTPLRMLFDLSSALATPMGRLRSPAVLSFPCLLHFPDCGTLLVRTSGADSTWAFAGRRSAREVQLSLQQGCPARRR